MNFRKLFKFLVVALFLFAFAKTGQAASRYWVGSDGGDVLDSANWSTAANDCGVSGGASVPGASDAVYFTSSCTNDATSTGSWSIASLTMQAGYTGTFTAPGTGNTLTISGNFTIVEEDAFDHNSGKIIASGGSATFDAPPAGVDFYEFEFSKTNGAYLVLATGDLFTVKATTTLTDGRFHSSGSMSTVKAEGPIVVNSTFDGVRSNFPAVNFLIDGEVDQSFNLPAGAYMPRTTLNNELTTITLTGSGTTTWPGATGYGLYIQNGTVDLNGVNAVFTGGFSQSGGTFIGGSGTIRAGGTFEITGGSFTNSTAPNESLNSLTISSGTFLAPSDLLTLTGSLIVSDDGFFDHNNGKVIISGATNAAFTTDDTVEFYEFEFNKDNNVQLTLANNYPFIVNATTTLTNGRFYKISAGDATFNAEGPVVVNSTFDGVNTTYYKIGFLIDGGEAQSVNIAAGAYMPKTTLNNESATITLTGSGTVTWLKALAGYGLNLSTGVVDLNGVNATFNGGFSQSGGTLRLTGAETVTGSVTMNTGSTVEYSGSDTLTINPAWSYQNLNIIATTTPTTATFTAGSTYTVAGTTTMSGSDESNLLMLRSSTPDTQWSIDPQGVRAITYVDVQDSNNINVLVIETTGLDSGNNINWDITSISTGNLIATTVGRHVTAIDPGDADVALDGAFVFYKESGTDTIEEITLTQFGTLEPEYIDDVQLNYVLETGTSSSVCPESSAEVESFDEDSPFGVAVDLDDASGTAEFSDSVEIPEGQVLCVYPEYSLQEEMGEYDSVGKTIKLGLDGTSSVVLADEHETTFLRDPLSVWGSTVLSQVGISTITFVKDDVETVFYVEGGVLYIQEGNGEPRRLTSRDVQVQYASFRNLTPVGSDRGQVEIILRLEHTGPNYVGSPVVQTFKTTINVGY